MKQTSGIEKKKARTRRPDRKSKQTISAEKNASASIRPDAHLM